MLDLNSIKENIQGIFETANTTTATTYLSNNLNTKVQKVAKLNPSRVPIQSSWYPVVTVFVDSKEVNVQDIAVNQTNSKRRADINIIVAGVVWNNIMVNKDVDEADDDCESLMENIEEILRANPTLGGTVTWSFPTEVTYHSTSIDEGCNLRGGFLNLRASVWY